MTRTNLTVCRVDDNDRFGRDDRLHFDQLIRLGSAGGAGEVHIFFWQMEVYWGINIYNLYNHNEIITTSSLNHQHDQEIIIKSSRKHLENIPKSLRNHREIMTKPSVNHY